MNKIVLLLSFIALSVNAAETTTEATPNRTKTLLETVANSLNDQSLSQYAYYLMGGANILDTKKSSGTDGNLTQANINLGIRLWKNIWLEGSYGRSLEADYPALGLDTRVERISGKFRYNIEATSYFHIQPYIGYYGSNVKSPGAGINPEGNPLSTEDLQKEIDAIASLRESGIAYGGSLILMYKRAAIKADIGNDSIGLGVGAFF